jgi:integrase
MSVVKGFFEFALVNEWIERNPARLVKAPRGRTTSSAARPERIPFSDDELRRMYHASRTLYAKKAPRRYSWTGEDLEDFISVSVYTGLRISDVATFHIDRLLPSGECHVRTTKSGRKVFTWVPDWLQRRMQIRANRIGPLIFGSHSTDDINAITDLWRRKLKRLWALCGPWQENPTPHRFRHTFARILLERSSVSIRDVAELLGDTEEVVRKHYAAWVPERQERLTTVLREAFARKPTPSTPPREPKKAPRTKDTSITTSDPRKGVGQRITIVTSTDAPTLASAND